MATARKTICLGRIADEVGVYVDQVPALDPASCDEPPIVERYPSGSLYIVDGFHRAAGMVRWCAENGLSIESVSIVVVVCDDARLIADAAGPGPRQQAAIEAIYAAAGLD